MHPYLIVGVIDSISPEYEQGGLLLAHHLPASRVFSDEWFMPSLVLENEEEESILEAFNNRMVNSFDKDFYLKSWGVREVVEIRGSHYNLVAMHGVLVNGIFRVVESSELYDAVWYSKNYDQYVRNKDLFKLITANKAS